MDWQTITLRELIARSDVSTRLKNASHLSAVFETTIREFLAMRPQVLGRLWRATHVGRTTIGELERLVDEYADAFPGNQELDPPVLAAAASGASLLDALPTEVIGVRLNVLVQQVGASARLANAARREPFFGATDVQSFLREHGATLPKLPNLGRTSVRELVALVDEYLACAKEVLDEVTSTPDQQAVRSRAATDTVAGALTEIFRVVASRRFAPAQTLDVLPPSEI